MKMKQLIKKQQTVLKIPFDESSASTLGKSFWRMAELYQFTQSEQADLLGIKYNRQRLSSLQNAKKIPLDTDKFFRVGQLLGIHKSLRLLFPHNREIVYSWMKTKREIFGGYSAVEFITQNPMESLQRLCAVRRTLEQIRSSV